MSKIIWVVITSIVLLSGCASSPPRQKPDQPSLSPEEQLAKVEKGRQAIEKRKNFPADVIRRLGSEPSLCDAEAIADRRTEWTCAGYTEGYKEFINMWESVANSIDFRRQYRLRALSGWMYFKEGDEIDFYAKAYRLENTQVVIAHDPSESGREIFIGIGLEVGRIRAHSSGLLGKDGEVEKPALKGSYNCSDFKNFAAAKKFFSDNNFTAAYDPYNLDADNNGIPCESFGRTSSPTSDTNKCPPGKSWVNAYTRSNGSRVRGHCRKRR